MDASPERKELRTSVTIQMPGFTILLIDGAGAGITMLSCREYMGAKAMTVPSRFRMVVTEVSLIT
jgi:hypothetical protein